MKKIYAFALISMAIIALLQLESCFKPDPNGPVAGLITGYVFTEIRIKDKPVRKMFLPDVIVTIKNPSGSTVAVDTTELDGGYRTKDLKPGDYTINLSKQGFISQSYKTTVEKATNHPGQLKINFRGNNYIFGTAKLADGFPAIFKNEVFGVSFFTTVFVDLNKDKTAVRCNTSGEFLLTGVPPKGRFSITASCQQAVANQTVQANGAVYDLVFKNTKPAIQYIVAFNERGKAVLRTLPSTKLKVVANTLDKEGQTLTYMWLPGGDYPGSSFSNSAEATWQLTAVKAKNLLTLLVMDDFGGAAFTSYSIDDNDGKVAFSGVALNIDGSGKIPGAMITINGQQVAATDSKGYFSVRVDEAENNRYVLNVEKPGFMLSSTIFQKEAFSQTYKLVSATVKEFDPGNDIVLTEEEDRFTKFITFDKEQKRRSRPAATIKIPAGSITDSNGNKVLSAVNVQLRTIDLYNSQGLMPGDYAAVENGSDKTLVSFGAIDVQIRDKANPTKRYNINPSALADIHVPISSDIQSAAPANIGLWDYNEKSGIWEKITTVSKNGDKYVGTTNKFSSINTDVAMSGGTCIYLQDNLNNPIFPGGDCDVTITIPTAGAPKIKHATISAADPTLIIARLPLNTNISIEVKRGADIVAARTLHTSSVSSGAASSIDPADPGTVCTNDFYKKDPPFADVTSVPFLSMVETLTEAQAIAYYRSTGAIKDTDADGVFELSEGETFAQWKARNNFGAGDDAHASYFNAGDLGFHRAMHQKGSGSHVAYYVSNYANAVQAEDDVFGVRSIVPNATVAMEYDFNANTGTRGIIKFYLFTGPGETLNTHVDLDGGGERFVPGLCIVCHGGREIDYLAVTSLQDYYKLNPTHSPAFLAFDAQSFEYSAAHDRPSQETELRKLNQQVYSANSTQAIKDFLNAAYSSTGTLAGNFADNSTAVNWLPGATNGINNAFFYSRVVGPSCRTCHASKSANVNLQFNTPSTFAAFPVCGPGKYMPNAKVTFINFWTSSNPYQPEQLRLFVGDQICE
jgi:hypothetical protein